MVIWASLVAQEVKNLPAMWMDLGSISGSGRSPGEGNGNPLQTPWTEETGALQSVGSQRVGHDCVTNTSTLFMVI